MLGIVENLIRELDENQVRYVHFKSNEHIDRSVEGKTDFDILVDRRCAAAYETVLRKLDIKRFASPVRAAYPAVDDWIGMDPDTCTFIHLHTHYQLVTGKSGYKNYVLPWAKIALEGRERDYETGIWFVQPEYELIELYTRIVAKMSIRRDWKACLRGYNLAGENLREARWLWDRVDDVRLEEMMNRCFGREAMRMSLALFRQLTFSPQEYRAFRRIVLNKLEPHQRAGMTGVSLRSTVHGFTGKVRGKLKRNFFIPSLQQKKYCHDGGMLIVFLGVDGSGKTTVSEQIHGWLSWKIETSRMSLGVGRKKQSMWFKLKKKIKALLGKKSAPSGGNKSGAAAPVDVAIERNFKNYRAQRYWLSFAKEVNRDIRKIHSYCLGGGIMVVDRYPQLEFPGIADGPKINCVYPDQQKKERKLLGIVEEIQPDMVFKLMVPVELSMERRPEDPPESLRRKYEILNSIHYPHAVEIVVDATQPLEEELLFIKRKIWEQM